MFGGRESRYPFQVLTEFTERERRKLTMATVRTVGLGMYAKPLRFGSPVAAVRLTLAPVTLKPAKPLSPAYVVVVLYLMLTVGRCPSCKLVLPVKAVLTFFCDKTCVA